MSPASRFLFTALTLAVLFDPAAGQSMLADHDAALAALARGEIKPLDEILASVKIDSESFVSVEFDKSAGRWLYAMTLLTASGRYRIVTVDAATAEILNEELK
jgi:uncharacterized membrane protein YkoI